MSEQKIELTIGGTTVWSSVIKDPGDAAMDQPGSIRDKDDAVKHFTVIANMKKEAFAVLPLNVANVPIRTARIVTVGLLDSNQIHPREVFADPITDRAAAIIVAHNHPSNTLHASPEDVAITRRLVKAGEILGIRVLDHVILTPNGGSVSMKEQGQL